MISVFRFFTGHEELCNNMPYIFFNLKEIACTLTIILRNLFNNSNKKIFLFLKMMLSFVLKKKGRGVIH